MLTAARVAALVLSLVGLAATAYAGTREEPALPGGPARSAGPAFSDPTRIDNPYLPISRHRRCESRGRAADGTRERSVRTRLERRRPFAIGGHRVDAVIIRDEAYEDGELVESTLDYLAQADDDTVHYLGEDVRNLAGGKLVDTQGSWRYGEDTDRLGVAMPSAPRLGSQWRFEDVPGVTTESDRVEEVGLRTRSTPASSRTSSGMTHAGCR